MVLRRYLFASLIVACLGCDAPSQSHAQAIAGSLTVVELFTSQGCSSCPPANANLARLARRSDILALSFGVDYWDYLGWADTYASPAFTQRQRDYARRLALRSVYTPQMVINGRMDLVGNNFDGLVRSVARMGSLRGGPTIRVRQGNLSLGATTLTNGPALVSLVSYDPRVTEIPIARGENRGKTLPHINVVKSVTSLGAYDGRATTFALPTATNSVLKSAILVQASVGGPILAAAKLN